MKKTISDSFVAFSGAVLQSRALVDSRDFLQPSARQIFYAMHTDKFTHNKPMKKTLKAIGSCFRFYIHGDSSALGILMRASQPFNMRYPLIEVEGSNGNLSKSGNWAQPRYTSCRLSEVSSYLFEDIEKNTVDWRLNFDDTEEYPAVLPTKGYFNLVNGAFGIGIGLASSVPSFAIEDVNKALIKLLWNPDATFEELYCQPDFATGGILINEEEVKKALQKGSGGSCKLRSKIEYNEKEHCLIVKEIPYGVYTETIAAQLSEIIYPSQDNENPLINPGISSFNDLTSTQANIKIMLEPSADPTYITNFLYKNTSLQSFYSINMTMLENGRFPKVFGWKELLQAHLDHEDKVFLDSYRFDLKKVQNRLHILEGLLMAISDIEEVLRIIKTSSNTTAAREALMNKYNMSEAQAKAILAMRLSQLAKLESTKIQEEHDELKLEAERLTNHIENKELRYKDIENHLLATAKKFGDGRRTQVMTVEEEDTKLLYFTSNGKCSLAKPRFGKVIGMEFSAAKAYLAVSRKGEVFKLYEVPKRSKQVFKLAKDDEIIYVKGFDESMYLSILNRSGNYRCLSISAMNKNKTTLSLSDITKAEVVSQKMTKAEYKKVYG